jgi:MATE family multidrug resistance protein
MGGAASWMSVSAALFWLAPGLLMSLMTDVPEVVRLGAPLLGVAAVFQLSDGFQAVGSGILRGAGDTRFSFVANVVGHYGVGLPVALVCAWPLGQGIFGLWWGLCAGLSAVALALALRFDRISRRGVRAL